VDYHLVGKNIAQTEERMLDKIEKKKIWDRRNRWIGFVSVRNHISRVVERGSRLLLNTAN
jgi:hypothetical protein